MAFNEARLTKGIPTSAKGDMLVAKWFYPDFGWTWYVAEYDPETKIAYGLVDGMELEYGSFSLDELMSTRGKLGMKLERDLYFTPVDCKTLYNQLTGATV